MLDKSLPYYGLVMMRPYAEPPAPPALPQGFSLRAYRFGDERAWARIETAVGEFDTQDDALRCFSHYLKQPDELQKRQWYVVNADDVPVATATGWYMENADGHTPVVHALACDPAYQGMGLGRAAAVGMIRALASCEPRKAIWLETQTWSYRAIGLYLSLGFVPLKNGTLGSAQSEYDAVLPILRAHMREDAFRQFLDAAIS